jgi:hypothetical protein
MEINEITSLMTKRRTRSMTRSYATQRATNTKPNENNTAAVTYAGAESLTANTNPKPATITARLTRSRTNDRDGDEEASGEILVQAAVRIKQKRMGMEEQIVVARQESSV